MPLLSFHHLLDKNVLIFFRQKRNMAKNARSAPDRSQSSDGVLVLA